jgi:hypothetical protein
MTPPPIDLHIEELVLHGLPPADRHRIGDAVQRELLRLFTAQVGMSPPAKDISVGHVQAPPLIVTPGSRAEEIGVQVARAIHASLMRSMEPAQAIGDAQMAPGQRARVEGGGEHVR